MAGSNQHTPAAAPDFKSVSVASSETAPEETPGLGQESEACITIAKASGLLQDAIS